MLLFEPDKMVERGFKTIILSFVLFMHYVVTGLIYFVPIDLTWRTIGQAPAILLGAFCLFIWSLISSWILVKSYEKKD